jgi:AraC-like DNA-binding protein
MAYREIKLEGFLSNFIKCLWTSQTFEETVENTILPDGYFDLILKLKNEKIDKITLTGLFTQAIEVKTEKNVKLFSIRFKPISAEYLFAKSIQPLLNLSMVLPNNFWDLDKLHSNTFEYFVEHIKSQISIILTNVKVFDERKINLFNLIFQNNIFSVKDISASILWDSRQINRYFSKQYGCSLKTYLNIVRCRIAYKDLAKSDLQPKSNYFDQAHFIKEVKKYTGVSPRELSKNKNDRFLQLSMLKTM